MRRYTHLALTITACVISSFACNVTQAAESHNVSAYKLVEDCKVNGGVHNQGPIVIQNVNVFNGKDDKLLKNATVLIEYARTPDITTGAGKTVSGIDVGYFIKEVAVGQPLKSTYDTDRVRVIDGKGATLMPGLIDSHTHLSWANAKPIAEFAQLIAEGKASFKDWPYYGQQASLTEAENRLMSGYTAVREVGGVGHLVKGCVDTTLNDKGVATIGRPGPRILYAGAVISPTGGHADAETDLEESFHIIKNLDQMSVQQRENLIMQADAFGMRKADGVSEVKRAIRDQFVKGAQFIKLATGGGSSSPHDPIDATTYSADEVRAATEVTDGLNTYATTHAYESYTVERDLSQGVQMVEHGNIITDKTASMLKAREKKQDARGIDTSVWLDISPFFDNQFANPKDGVHLLKQRITQKGTLCSYGYIKKHQLQNVGFAVDVMFEKGGAVKAPMILAHMPKDLEPLTRPGTGHQCVGLDKPYHYSNFDILKMAVYNNGQILTKSGPRTPYAGTDGTYLKPGTIGVIAPGAVADVILVNGNPLESLDMFYDVKENIRLIMKDGIVYKNTLN